MKNNSRKGVAVLVAFALLVTPALGFAKVEKEKVSRKTAVKTEVQNPNNGCPRGAWGHLIARGYIKNFGALNINPNCVYPYGISKKLWPNATSTATTTPDTVAPVISNITTTHLSSTSVRVMWNTNEKATSKVYYKNGTSIDVNSTTTPFVNNNSLVFSHSLTLSSLATSTQYQYVIESKDASGNMVRGPQISITTLAF